MTVIALEQGAAPVIAAEPPMEPVAPAYVHVLRVHAALFWLPVAVALAVVDLVVLPAGIHTGFLAVGGAALALMGITLVPQRIYARLGYRLREDMLQSVRGWLFRTDTLVPFVRVQHIDVTHGPIEKAFGTASLVVHTAGTHNSIVTINGLTQGEAERIREIIRARILSDFE